MTRALMEAWRSWPPSRREAELREGREWLQGLAYGMPREHRNYPWNRMAALSCFYRVEENRATDESVLNVVMYFSPSGDRGVNLSQIERSIRAACEARGYPQVEMELLVGQVPRRAEPVLPAI